MTRQIFVGLLITSLLFVSGTVAWLYLSDLPRQTPVKAKQVFRQPVWGIKSV